MIYYRTDDGWYFTTEKEAKAHCGIFTFKAKQLEDSFREHGEIDGSAIKAVTDTKVLYEKVDLSDPETVVEMIRDYNELVKTVDKLKKWVHFKDN